MINQNRLSALAAAQGTPLSLCQLEQLAAYAGMLKEWNRKINLTAIIRPEEVEIKHFLDCLLFAAQPQVAGGLVDVGSGAGFPGIVVKIFRPQLQITLMEPNGKRGGFLRYVLEHLGLEGRVLKARAEEAAKIEWRESFDIATARAVAPLMILCEYCLPLVKQGGFFIAMKGAEAEAVSQGAVERLGGRFLENRKFTLPGGAHRTLQVFEKTAPTPGQYPRNGGVIAKRPLRAKAL
jgi:16S rRNA (guanine527-N7)-methyltransferase